MEGMGEVYWRSELFQMLQEVRTNCKTCNQLVPKTCNQLIEIVVVLVRQIVHACFYRAILD